MFEFIKNWWRDIDWEDILAKCIACIIIVIVPVLVFFTLKFTGDLLYKLNKPEPTYVQLRLPDGTLLEGEVEYSSGSVYGDTYWIKLKGDDMEYTINGSNVIFFKKK